MVRRVIAELQGRAVYLAYRSLALGLSWAPERFADNATAGVAETMAKVNHSHRQMAERHLARVLASNSPGATPDPQVVRRWARRSFRAYGRYWAEGARLSSMDTDRVISHMVIESGYEHLVAAMEEGRGVVMALPHVGSWEWGGAFLASEGFPMTSVAERLEPQALFDWFLDQRKLMGLHIVALDNDASGVLLRTLGSGGLVGLVCDRDIGGSGVEVELFGEKTTLPAGPATMALRTGATLLAAVVFSGPRQYHTGLVSAPLPTERSGRLRDDVVRVTQAIAWQFEDFIRRSPEQWHLFQPNWPSDSASSAR